MIVPMATCLLTAEDAFQGTVSSGDNRRDHFRRRVMETLTRRRRSPAQDHGKAKAT